jgi:hypothetical protein
MNRANQDTVNNNLITEAHMNYYYRFTEDIQGDVERGTSILTNHNNMIVDGLCAFVGKETVEDTKKSAEFMGKITGTEPGAKYAILKGSIMPGKRGSMGVVIKVHEIIEECVFEGSYQK